MRTPELKWLDPPHDLPDPPTWEPARQADRDPAQLVPGDWYDPESLSLAIGARRIFLKSLDEHAEQVREELIEGALLPYVAWVRDEYLSQWEKPRPGSLSALMEDKWPNPPSSYLARQDRLRTALLDWSRQWELPPDPEKRPQHWMLDTALSLLSSAYRQAEPYSPEGYLRWDLASQTKWSYSGFVKALGWDPDFEVEGWSPREPWTEFEARVRAELQAYRARAEARRRDQGLRPAPRLRAAKGSDDPDLHRKARWLVRWHVLDENQEEVADDEDIDVRSLREACVLFREWIDLPKKKRRARPKKPRR